MQIVASRLIGRVQAAIELCDSLFGNRLTLETYASTAAKPHTSKRDMQNTDDQNPYAALKSQGTQPKNDRVGRSNECLWLGIISAGGFIVAFLLFYCFGSSNTGTSIAASMFGMLLCVIAGGAGIAGLAVGSIEAIAQLTSSSVFGQKETVFLGIALSLTGPGILVFQCLAGS